MVAVQNDYEVSSTVHNKAAQTLQRIENHPMEFCTPAEEIL